LPEEIMPEEIINVMLDGLPRPLAVSECAEKGLWFPL